MSNGSWIPYKRALASIPTTDRYAEMIRHGTMSAGLYAPHQTDDQEPHDQDEVYVVIDGSGFFRIGDERQPFGPGDMLWVRAGVDHRFEDFTPNFSAWVIFYGSEGGEAAD
jgi:mannose-6-phosphate isomerase-like protein (cupin superfamily)